MSAIDRFDQRFEGLLEDLGAASYPDYFDDALEVAVHRTQRPSWTFPERWLPMGVLAQRPAMVPTVPWRAIGIVAILALLGVALAIAIGSQRRVPPPFGPAANGVVAAMRDGDIYVHDVAAGTQRLIVGGDELDVYPIFSRDGARLAFLRFADEAAVEGTLFVVAPDGSGPRALFGPEPFQAAAWSPSSDRLAVITGEAERSLWIVPADGSDPSGPLDLGGVTPLRYSDVLWRPPDGRELVFKGVLEQPVLDLLGSRRRIGAAAPLGAPGHGARVRGSVFGVARRNATHVYGSRRLSVELRRRPRGRWYAPARRGPSGAAEYGERLAPALRWRNVLA